MNLVLNKIRLYLILFRFHKPAGFLLLLWPCLWAIWISSEGTPDSFITNIFIIGVVLMRSAGCVINDFFDKKIDAKVFRTRNRPIASNQIKRLEGLLIFIILICLSGYLVSLLNKKAILVALISLVFVFTYPLAKRFFLIPQAYLGITFNFGIPIAYYAQINQLTLDAYLLFLANFFWIFAYDTQYAISDKNDDIKVGVKSSAIFFGKFDFLMIIIFKLFFIFFFLFCGYIKELGWIFYLSIIVSSIIFFYKLLFMKDRSAKKCQSAFESNSLVGLIIFLGIFLNYNHN